jgi:hypothetical protein
MAIKGHLRAINGHPRAIPGPVHLAISGHLAISRNQSQSVAISRNQSQSVAISRNQSQSVAISRNLWPSTAIKWRSHVQSIWQIEMALRSRSPSRTHLLHEGGEPLG